MLSGFTAIEVMQVPTRNAFSSNGRPKMTKADSSTDTIVLIHGLWMTPLAWEHWVTHYEARGFTVLTPGYPGIETWNCRRGCPA